VLYDHTSVLAFVESKWNLPALTYRDANANDLLDFLDVPALRAGRPTFPKLPALAAPGDTSARLACSVSGPGTIPPPGSIQGPGTRAPRWALGDISSRPSGQDASTAIIPQSGSDTRGIRMMA
jgi:hypothetical protein